MKLTKYLLAIAALTVALTLSAKADLVDLGGVAFQGGPGGNSPAANLAALEASGVDTTGFVLCGNSVNGETSVDVPLTGPGPFGFGGISSIREFCPPGTHVPDSGTTAMLLGSALTGLGLVRRYLKR